MVCHRWLCSPWMHCQMKNGLRGEHAGCTPIEQCVHSMPHLGPSGFCCKMPSIRAIFSDDYPSVSLPPLPPPLPPPPPLPYISHTSHTIVFTYLKRAPEIGFPVMNSKASCSEKAIRKYTYTPRNERPEPALSSLCFAFT